MVQNKKRLLSGKSALGFLAWIHLCLSDDYVQYELCGHRGFQLGPFFGFPPKTHGDHQLLLFLYLHLDQPADHSHPTHPGNANCSRSELDSPRSALLLYHHY